MKPIFIFSLPRSGSTLLQRMLSTSDDISTASETWILLPFLYTMKTEGSISEYWHSLTVNAITDFYNGFPNQKQDYLSELRDFTLNLYAKRSQPGCSYFLDKTPRYHLICKEIIDLFPEGKFIFLWRNPLATVASMVNSWAKGKWKLTYHKVDLYQGLSNLIETYENHKPEVHSLQFENLLLNPHHELRALCDYLEIDFREEMTTSFSNTLLDGRMGDRLGVAKYKQLHQGSVENWSKTYFNHYRQRWARRYLRWIGHSRMTSMGYDIQDILSKTKSVSCRGVSSIAQDFLNIAYHGMQGKIKSVYNARKENKWYIYN